MKKPYNKYYNKKESYLTRNDIDRLSFMPDWLQVKYNRAMAASYKENIWGFRDWSASTLDTMLNYL